MNTRIAVCLALLCTLLAPGFSPAIAQSDTAAAGPTRPSHRIARVRPRIEVSPNRLLYRQCVDGYREVWRPYWGGKVVMPYMHCWWVRG